MSSEKISPCCRNATNQTFSHLLKIIGKKCFFNFDNFMRLSKKSSLKNVLQFRKLICFSKKTPYFHFNMVSWRAETPKINSRTSCVEYNFSKSLLSHFRIVVGTAKPPTCQTLLDSYLSEKNDSRTQKKPEPTPPQPRKKTQKPKEPEVDQQCEPTLSEKSKKWLDYMKKR